MNAYQTLEMKNFKINKQIEMPREILAFEQEKHFPAPDELHDFYINDADAGSFEGEE